MFQLQRSVFRQFVGYDEGGYPVAILSQPPAHARGDELSDLLVLARAPITAADIVRSPCGFGAGAHRAGGYRES